MPRRAAQQARPVRAWPVFVRGGIALFSKVFTVLGAAVGVTVALGVAVTAAGWALSTARRSRGLTQTIMPRFGASQEGAIADA